MTSFAALWSALATAGGPPPYLLIDGAGVDGGAARIPREPFCELECLFTGELANELEDVAPYLARLKSFDDDVKPGVESLLRSESAILVQLGGSQADVPFAAVRRHFRRFNVVYGPEGRPLFLRYCDPRVLPQVLGVLQQRQIEDFFGPVQAFIRLDASGRPVRHARPGPPAGLPA